MTAIENERFGSNSEIYRVPCDENEKTVDVIERAIEIYKKCKEKEHLDVEVKYLTNRHGESIITLIIRKSKMLVITMKKLQLSLKRRKKRKTSMMTMIIMISRISDLCLSTFQVPKSLNILTNS